VLSSLDNRALAGVMPMWVSPGYKAPRTGRKPDLNGIWELEHSKLDIQDHARERNCVALGAAFSVPAGRGVVEGNEITLSTGAAAKKQENFEKW